MRQLYTQRRNKLRIDKAIIYCEGSDVNTEYMNQILYHLKHATLTHTDMTHESNTIIKLSHNHISQKSVICGFEYVSLMPAFSSIYFFPLLHLSSLFDEGQCWSLHNLAFQTTISLNIPTQELC